MRQQAENLEALTSLRFFAAAAIVWLHAALYFPWAQGGLTLPYAQGVSFFFVLSGFIITHVYGNKAEPYGRFMWKRFARLWPVHITTLVCVPLFVRPDSVAFDGPGLLGKWWSFAATVALLQSWVPTVSYAFAWNSVSWSISTEFFFYAVFPLLLIAMRRHWAFPLLATAAPILLMTIAARYWAIPASGDVFDVSVTSVMYAGPPFRVFEFAVGMVAYLIWQRSRTWLTTGTIKVFLIDATAMTALALWLGWGFYAAAAYAATDAALQQWTARSSSCFVFAAAIVVLAVSAGPVGWLLRRRLLIWLGEVSFALYMVHQIVMKVLSLSFPGLSAPWIVLPICLLAAAMLHHLVEKPAQRFLTRRIGSQTPAPVPA